MSPRELLAAFWAAMQANDWEQAARYPSNAGHWRFDVHRLAADGEQITRQVDCWPAVYEPVPGREDLTRSTERIP